MELDRSRPEAAGRPRGGEASDPSYLSLVEAARLLPAGRNGRPTHVATLVRWITGGSRGPDGSTVRLRAVRLGNRWLTTREWLDEFAARLTPDFGDRPAPHATVARSRSAERAGRELDAIGI